MIRFLVLSICLFSVNVFSYELIDKEIILYGLKIKDSKASDMREAIIENGGISTGLSRRNYQTFNPKTIFKEAKELEIWFDKEGNLGALIYQIPFSEDSKKIIDIKKIIECKYGAPSFLREELSLEKVSYEWNFEGGMSIDLYTDFSNKIIILRYANLEIIKIILEEEEERERLALEKAASSPFI